jgi:hypothetical protein
LQKEPSSLKAKLALSMPPKVCSERLKILGVFSLEKLKKKLFTTYVFVLKATPARLSM